MNSDLKSAQNLDSILENLREELEKSSALEVAELFLSPHIHDRIFLEATREPGPSMWIVNRSDVTDKTLEKLHRHSISSIATRAAEKFKSRKSTITHLSAPIVEEALSEVADFAIEDILGHPLCPWDAMLYFAKSANEDVRSSACLSVTRRLWEHPNQSLDFERVQNEFRSTFSHLAAHDPSPMVRSYATRIPFWKSEEIETFFKNEASSHVQSKWLQHDSSTLLCLDEALSQKEIPLRRIAALDARLSSSARKTALATDSTDRMERLIHEAYLAS